VLLRYSIVPMLWTMRLRQNKSFIRKIKVCHNHKAVSVEVNNYSFNTITAT